MLDLSRLTPQQRAVVVATEGPMVILAGPGSGKTLVVAARIAYLVAARNVPPTSILAVTFTTAAARELRARLIRILGNAGGSVDVSTFHALGLRIVRTWSKTLGLSRGQVVVYGAADARALLHQVARDAGARLDRAELGALAARLERYRLLHPYGAHEDRGSDANGVAVASSTDASEVAWLARVYEAVLLRRGAVDYAAMLALPLRLFEERPDAMRLHQDAYRYVLGDEGQDVCPAQQALLLLLAARHHNLSVVGDACQAVFAWRGADAGFLARFAHDVPGAQVLSLDECFRCSGRVLAVANALGAPLDHYRPIRTANDAGPPPRLYAAPDPPGEAAFVAHEIERLRGQGEIADLGEIGVLYRTNGQAHEFQLALRSRGLPYRTHGPDLFARREVADVLAYLRLAVNPDDAAALARIVNRPPRGLDRLAAQLRRTPIPLSALRAAADTTATAGAAAGHVDALVALVRELHQLLGCAADGSDMAPAAAVDAVLALTGYRAWLRELADGATRLAALDTLRAFAERASCGLSDWLAELALADTEAGAGLEGGDPATPAGDTDGRVALSTIHGAKGREWDAVFVAGVEEGLLPHVKALALADRAGREALMEERRLAYVAVTRARRLLYLTYCHTRRRGDRLEARRPSRFLAGLPLQPIEAARGAPEGDRRAA